MHARPPSKAERVAVQERRAVVAAIWDRDARADRVAGSNEGPQVRLECDPERGYYEMVPAAVAASAAATTNLARNRFLRAQRARAIVLSSFIAPAYRRGRRLAAKEQSRGPECENIA